MEKIEVICQICDNHCHMEVEHEDGEVTDVSGNSCMKGMAYAQEKLNE